MPARKTKRKTATAKPTAKAKRKTAFGRGKGRLGRK